MMGAGEVVGGSVSEMRGEQGVEGFDEGGGLRRCERGC